MPCRSAYSSIQVSAARASNSRSRTSLVSPVQRSYSSMSTTIERGGVRRAVVGGVRPLLERGQLAVAHLVEDATRVLVPEVVELGALAGAERPQGGRRPARARTGAPGGW